LKLPAGKIKFMALFIQCRRADYQPNPADDKKFISDATAMPPAPCFRRLAKHLQAGTGGPPPLSGIVRREKVLNRR
jgi:hypothetical protein